jgi:hypothetical protein
MTQEIWKPFLDGYYEASSLGRVRRAKPWRRWHPLINSYCDFPANGEALKPHRRSDGRLQLMLSVERKKTPWRVHQCVAEAFHGPCPDGLEIDHVDGDPMNNRPERHVA